MSYRGVDCVRRWETDSEEHPPSLLTSFVDCELKDNLKWCFLDHDSVWFLWTVCILWCGQQGMSHRNTQRPGSAGGMYMSFLNVRNILVSIPICICRELDISTHTYTNIRLHTRAFSETTWWRERGLNILPIHLICQCQGAGGMRDTLCLRLMLGRSCWHEKLRLSLCSWLQLLNSVQQLLTNLLNSVPVCGRLA